MPRDISGNYTLPVGNPVVSGTIIDVAWANPTMSDIATQLNNVITRDGVLPATGPIRFTDGSVGAPAITFTGAPATGIYRSGTTIGFSIAGTNVASVTTGGASILGTLSLQQTVGSFVQMRDVGDATIASASPYLNLQYRSADGVTNYPTYFQASGRSALAGGPWGYTLMSGQTRRNMFETDMVRTTPMTVAQLPTAAQAGKGTRAYVTDATSIAFAALLVGGGVNDICVFSNGTNWYIG